MICVYVYVAPKDNPPDVFYIFKILDFQRLVHERYVPREEPKKVDSFHHAFRPGDLQPWEGKWKTLEAAFGNAPPVEPAA